MVIILVAITLLLIIAVDFFIKKRKKASVAAEASERTFSLSQIFNMLPAGVFLQPSFTWSKVMDTGNIMVGIHPVLFGLIGKIDKVEMQEGGAKIKKGEPILKLHSNSKSISVKSPVDGEILMVNPEFEKTGDWQNLDDNWLYGVHPENISADIPNWYIADKAKNLLQEKFQKIRDFIIQNQPQTALGTTMPDGGDLPVGILSTFDSKLWAKFESEFIQ
jgi:glycine cleavage system H lipoate-binding protein